MTIKSKLTFIVSAVFSGLILVTLIGPFESAQEVNVQANVDIQQIKVDDQVKPAAAEVDLIASPLKSKSRSRVRTAIYETASNPNQQNGVIRDSEIQLCQGVDCGTDGVCQTGTVGGMVYEAPVMDAPVVQQAQAHAGVGYTMPTNQFGYVQPQQEFLPSKRMCGVDGNTKNRFAAEPRWANSKQLDWEQYSYGEYVGPFRTPHVPDYRVRIGDRLEFVYLITRRKSSEPYRLYVGDTIQITSTTDSTLTQPKILILSDGTISLPLIGNVRAAGKTITNLQRELNDRYTEFVKAPEIVVQVVEGDTPLNDLRDAVDARAGQGGQSRFSTVAPDGTIQLPLIGCVPAIGLTLEEIGREVNARYRLYLGGVVATPILDQRAPRFIYVVGEVEQGGRFELTGPTSAMQAISLAQGFRPGGNLRQIIVFRRDANWQLIATRLDLSGALNGRRPHPSDEIWLRDSDIILVPKRPIQRLSEAVNQYFTETIYGIFPIQGVAFGFDNFQTL